MSTELPRKRVFIADPSFQDWLGHHAPYDLSAKEAVEKAGAEAIILANRSVNIGAETAAAVEKVFSRTAWGAGEGPSGVRRWKNRGLLKLNRILSAPLAWQKKPAAQSAFAQRPSGFLSLFYQAFKKGLIGLTPPFLTRFLSGCLSAASESMSAATNRYSILWDNFLHKIAPTHFYVWLHAGSGLADYYELTEALEKNDFGTQDTVFAHMATFYSLPTLALFASRLTRKENAGQLVLLFRYPRHFIDNGSPLFREYVQLLEKAFLAGRLRGATDSDLLARDHAEFLAVPLVVFPICHIPEFDVSGRTDGGRDRPLTCVSLGNSRAEKGILEIFQAIRILNERGLGSKFRFNLQVNHPDAESAEAVRLFINEAPPNVEFKTSSLSPDEYEELLVTSDVVLAPYWSDVYAARTSGVALEGMAAGKIVVSTTGSWMEHELNKFEAGCKLVPSRDAAGLAEALAEIAEDPEPYLRRAGDSAVKMRAFHCGENMASLLLDGPVRQSVSEGDAIQLCYPFDDFFEKKSGSSVRVNFLADLLENYRVIPWQPSAEQAGSTSRLTPIMYHESPEPRFRRWLINFLCWRDPYGRFLFGIFQARNQDREFKLRLLQSMLGCRAVIVEYVFYVKQIAPYAQALGLPLLVTAVDHHAAAYSRWSLKHQIIKKWENAAARQADVFFTVSESEHKYFAGQGLPNVLAPNCTDNEALKEKMRAGGNEQRLRDVLGPDIDAILFFVGSNHPPNVRAKDLIKEIAAEAAADGRTWKFVTAGSCSDPSETGGNFYALGKVSDELLGALYAGSRLIVSPLPAGTGASIKTVEAMGVGKVILGSSLTFRGLAVMDGRQCFIEDDPARYLERLKALLDPADSETLLEEVASRAEKFGQMYDYRVAFKPYLEALTCWPPAANDEAAAEAESID